MEINKESMYQVCPYLGVRSDPGTALSFPSYENYCFHQKIGEIISLEHQDMYCLRSDHVLCDVFASNPLAPLPVSHSFPTEANNRGLSPLAKWLIALLILGAGMIIAGMLLVPRFFFPKVQRVPTMLPYFTLAPLVLTDTEFSPSDSPSSTISSTPSLQPALGLETPLGLNHRFIIHVIQLGESLELIAREYGTTIEAIQACNYQLPSPLLPGVVVVVPLNFVDMDGIPRFEVYGVTREMSLTDLAAQFMVELDDLKYYNAFTWDLILSPGDWVLIPRLGTPTP